MYAPPFAFGARIQAADCFQSLRNEYLEAMLQPGKLYGISRTMLAIADDGAPSQEVDRSFFEVSPARTLPSRTCCSEMVVSRRAILLHPRETYQELLRWIEASTTLPWGWMFERSWEHIFAKKMFFVDVEILFNKLAVNEKRWQHQVDPSD